MKHSTIIHSLLLSLALAGPACAGGARVTSMPTAAAATGAEQTQSPAITVQSFTAVEGADLTARLEAARARARSGQTPFCSAYAFDAPPRIPLHPRLHQSHAPTQPTT